MQPEKRKLGRVNKFYVCPDCGLREQQNQEQDSLIIEVREEREEDDYNG